MTGEDRPTTLVEPVTVEALGHVCSFESDAAGVTRGRCTCPTGQSWEGEGPSAKLVVKAWRRHYERAGT
jgi:hypothetical protein